MSNKFKNIELVIYSFNEKPPNEFNFKNESLKITRGRNLQIENINKNKKESEFIKSMEINYELDKSKGLKTKYKLEVKDRVTPIKWNCYYTISSINKEMDTITFKILEY